MPRLASIAALLLVLACAQRSKACVWLMGEAKDSQAPPPAGSHWNYAFRGDNWAGVDASNKSWSCLSGKKQSPINLLSSKVAGSSTVKTKWKFTPLKSNGTNVQVLNNGHTIQVQWAAGALEHDVTAYAAKNLVDVVNGAKTDSLKAVKLTPLQFHFHTNSEHVVDGAYSPIEMHIVHSVPQSDLPGCPPTGCLSVVGVLMHISPDLDTGNKALDVIFNAMSETEGVTENLPAGAVLDIEGLMPPRNKRAYMQYEGSLTTPPCTEGLLWHVLKAPVYISRKQYNAYSRAVGLKECNATDATTRRALSEDGHHHHHHHQHAHSDLLGKLGSFQRGSYSGFVQGDDLRRVLKGTDGAVRRMLLDTTDSGATYQCHVASYGWSNRNVQSLNGRTVFSYN